jgi:hypothetical protein
LPGIESIGADNYCHFLPSVEGNAKYQLRVRRAGSLLLMSIILATQEEEFRRIKV